MGLVEFLSSFGLSDAWIFCILMCATHDILVYSSTLFLALVDHFDLLERYKIQKSKFPPYNLYKKAFAENVVRSILNIPSLWAVYHALNNYNSIRLTGPLDSWLLFFAKTVVFFVFLDFMFYWSHRLAHHPAIYKHVHKQHHEFKQSVGIAFEYAGIIEQIFGNCLFVSLFCFQLPRCS